MDKNFVNIDDLVRQRLGGAEEKQRAGAWLQMRDLLDKEMPQDKFAGMIFWQKSLTFVGLLLLATAIGLGSYELSASKNLDKNDVVAISNTLAANPIISENNIKNEHNNSQLNSQSTVTPKNKKVSVNTDNKHNIVSNESAKIKSSLTANNIGKSNLTSKNEPNTALTTKNNSTEPFTNIGKNRNSIDNFVTNSSVATEKLPKQNKNKLISVTKNTNTKTEQKVTAIANTNEETSNTKALVAKNTKTTNNEVVVSNAKHTKLATTLKGNGQKGSSIFTTAKIEKETTKADSKVVSASLNVDSKKVPKSKISTDINSTDTKALTTKNTKLSNKSASAPIAVNTKGASKNATIKSNNLDEQNNASKNVNKVANVTKPTTAITRNNAKTNTQSKIYAGSVNKTLATNKTVLNNKIDGTTNTLKEVTNNNTNNNNKGNKQSERKVVEKYVVSKHFVQTDNLKGYYHYDTLLHEQLLEETFPVLIANAGNVNTANNKTANDSELAAANAEAKLDAENKQVVLAKKTAGAKMLEKLNAAFNDIKDQSKGVQFASGLTGGINGTFFGPNSFKGFQFGVGASINFGELFSLVSELKYFYRMNNNYVLNDDYYHYEQFAGSSSYTKSVVSYSFSFSSLHSLEMPIFMRLNHKNFSAYAGGNMVYSFGVGTNAQPLATKTSVVTTTKLNDDHPTLSNTDFGQRFGLGYLFGITYRISPRLSLDLRNVQTVWDNMKTDGAKSVSNTLYKSPSLQLSMGFRFGLHRHEDIQ